MTFLCCCVVTRTEEKWLAGDGDGASVYPEFIDPMIPIDTEEVEENDSDCHSGKPSIWFWDSEWCSDLENHTKFKFAIVEILDVHANASVSNALLVKFKGFVSRFNKTTSGGLNDRKILGNGIRSEME